MDLTGVNTSTLDAPGATPLLSDAPKDPPSIKAKDLTRVAFADSHNLFDQVCKTENIFSAIFTCRAINKGSAKLLRDVTADPSKEQKVEAVIITKASREARSQENLSAALKQFNTSLGQTRSRFLTAFTEGFNPDLINKETKELFLYFARKEAMSLTQIKAVAESFPDMDISIKEDELVTLYTSDPKCQANTKAKLAQIKKEVLQLEKPARVLKDRKLRNISFLDQKVRALEEAYFATSAKVDTLVQKMESDPENFTKKEEEQFTSLSSRVDAQFADLSKMKGFYDQETNFHLYLDQHVQALSANLQKINELKIAFKDLQTPFIEASPSSAQTEILNAQTTPRLDDVSDPSRFPSLRPLTELIGNLKEAVVNNQIVMASRIFYELEQFVSPVEGLDSAHHALLAQIEQVGDDAEIDGNQIFTDFIKNPETARKPLILRALDTLRALKK